MNWRAPRSWRDFAHLTLPPVMGHQGKRGTNGEPFGDGAFDFDDNGTIFPDDEGTEGQDLAAVKYEAIKALAEMTKDALPDGDHHKFS